MLISKMVLKVTAGREINQELGLWKWLELDFNLSLIIFKLCPWTGP
jgi:hypothetical protein